MAHRSGYLVPIITTLCVVLDLMGLSSMNLLTSIRELGRKLFARRSPTAGERLYSLARQKATTHSMKSTSGLKLSLTGTRLSSKHPKRA